MAKKSNTEPTSDGLPLVAVDMGSASFKFAAAKLTGDTYPCTISILASEQSSKYSGVVKKGVVDNTSNASYRLRESMLLMSNRLSRSGELPTAFTLYGGKSLRTTDITVKRSQGTSMPVSQKRLDDMRDECFVKVAKSGKDRVGLDARLYSITLDGTEYSEVPSGKNAVMLEARYSTFYGNPFLRDRVQGSFDRAGKSIEQAFARPEALVEALADENDELTGLCIIDMGAETTSIIVYKGGRYLTCRTLPFGGSNITSDIEYIGMSASDAEKLKLRFGSAVVEDTAANGKKYIIRVPAAQEGQQPLAVKPDFLSQVIIARLDEIMQPIFQELKLYEDQIGVVYLTGGASKMKNMVEYVQQHTTLPVSYGSHAAWLAPGTSDEWQSPEYSALVGALLLGAKYRQANPGKAINKTKIVDKKPFWERIGDLFTPPAN